MARQSSHPSPETKTAGARPTPGKTPTLEEERLLWSAGHRWVAGLDEVGRGAWAGSVTVGIAIIDMEESSGPPPSWLRDSKLLTEERREAGFDEIAEWCAAWSVSSATPVECDSLGMTAALSLAARRAFNRLPLVPDAVIMDGPLDYTDLLQVEGELPLQSGATTGSLVTLTGADARCVSVAAASVLAKVSRDRVMRDEAEHFPMYSFERNKGYPSPVHQIALRGYGLSAIHRRSWKYVDDLPWGAKRERPGSRTI